MSDQLPHAGGADGRELWDRTGCRVLGSGAREPEIGCQSQGTHANLRGATNHARSHAGWRVCLSPTGDVSWPHSGEARPPELR